MATGSTGNGPISYVAGPRSSSEAFIEAATVLMSVESYHQKRQVRWDPVNEEIV